MVIKSTIQILISTLLIGTLIVSLIDRNEKETIKIFVNFLCLTVFLMSVSTLHNFIPNIGMNYQYVYEIQLIPQYSLNLSFGVNGLNIFFWMLVSFIMAICVYAAEAIDENYKEFIIYLLLIETFLILTFLSKNLFFFYVFFESVLIPMYFLIGLWGSRERKINAAYYIFLYTLLGSFFLLFGILYVYNLTGTLDNSILLNTFIKVEDQKFLWIFFFLPFAIKIPMFPFHLWLLEAHVEAPTIGSVILASLLLKLGGFGFLQYTITLVPAGCDYFSWVIYSLAILSIVYASFATMRQNDLKRIIAYSSIAHMNLAVLGIFSFTPQGITGAIYLMISHGIVSAALFFCVGVLYDRYHTRSLRNYSGLALVMPLFCTFFFLFTCANMSFPATANFIGEFLIFNGIFDKNSFIMVLSATSIFLSAIYSIWYFNRIAFGSLKSEDENIPTYTDLNRREYIILCVLFIGMLVFGVYSSGVTDLVDSAVEDILALLPYKR